jgi:hypothetical protein
VIPFAPMRNLLLVASLVVLGCGGQSAETKPTTQAKADNPEAPPEGNPLDSDAGAKTDETAPKKDPCVGFEMELDKALMQSACEVPNPKPDAKPVDLKGKLAVSLTPSSPTVSPGGHADLTLTLANKSGSPLPLYFTLDPTPRFPTETYNKKKHRMDMPSSKPPPLPRGMAPREATSHETARVTLVPNGTAKLTVPWSAVKMRWAPKKLKGTPPEEGYPREPSGPLARGKYTVRVAMPLVLVFEGMDREVSAPSAQITVK